jgi:phage terminase large subunit
MSILVPTTGSTRRPAATAHSVFAPLAWQVAPWRDQSPTILLTGSAGGGKSRLAAEKLHGYCQRYPQAMALVLRKVKVSMTSGAVLLLDRRIIGADPRVVHLPSKSRFEYSNGSILAYAGLEDEAQRNRLKSIGQDGAVDIVWMEEATEFEEADYNAVLARLRGHAASWRQIILSCNPDAPTHWIKRRLIDGDEATVYYSAATDNPHNPADYHVTLQKLTGLERSRLVDGLWVQATGIIYDQFRDSDSVSVAAEYEPDAGPVLWALDDGYAGARQPDGSFSPESHPRAILLCQQRADGCLNVFAESYAVQTLSDDHIRVVLELPYPRPDQAVHGPGAAEFRGRLFAAGLAARNASHTVEDGIKNLNSWLGADENGVRRVRIHPRCGHLRRELASYRRDISGAIIKAHDHGPDALRYLCWSLRHDR